MARDYTSIGPSPCDEECVPVGADDYTALARAECRRFIERIREVLGDEPLNARLAIRAERGSDYGTYYEVVCYYEDFDETAADYAFRCEAEAPARWAD